MKIFMTGVTGYIGGAIARELLKAGHSVAGLTRSAEKTQALRTAGAEVVVGDLKKPDSYERHAKACDVLIHAGFEYGPQAEEADKTAILTLSHCAREGGKPRLFIYTSGVWVLGPAGKEPATEESPLNPARAVAWRPAHEELVLRAASAALSTVVVRPGCVYGNCRGLYGNMLNSLFSRRVITLIGNGMNRWASVYLNDAAELYRLIVEKRPARAIYHATDGSTDTLDAVAQSFIEAAGGGSVEATALVDARREMGVMADALAMDQWVSSEKARRELGWKPVMTSAAANAAALLKEYHTAATATAVA